MVIATSNKSGSTDSCGCITSLHSCIKALGTIVVMLTFGMCHWLHCTPPLANLTHLLTLSSLAELPMVLSTRSWHLVSMFGQSRLTCEAAAQCVHEDLNMLSCTWLQSRVITTCWDLSTALATCSQWRRLQKICVITKSSSNFLQTCTH